MVQAGAGTDATIDAARAAARPRRHHHRRRQRLLPGYAAPQQATCEAQGFRFIGAGVSGGEEGALKGPSIMPGGQESAYKLVEPILTAISAKVNGDPCCTYIGPDGAGHYVKMVHNGIEYGDMQLICEAYDLLNDVLGVSTEELHDDLHGMEQRRARQLPDRDHRRHLLANTIRKRASRWSTSSWTPPDRRARANGRAKARSTSACRCPSSRNPCSPASCPR